MARGDNKDTFRTGKSQTVLVLGLYTNVLECLFIVKQLTGNCVGAAIRDNRNKLTLEIWRYFFSFILFSLE